MPSEALGMLAAAVAVIAILTVGATIMAAQNYAQRQLETQALQDEYNTQLQYMIVANGANPAAGWWPNQPGAEADGGTYTYYTTTTKDWEYTTYDNYLQPYTYWYPTSQPQNYYYTTYTSYYEAYSYQVPQTKTNIGFRTVTSANPIQESYTTYTQGQSAARYSTPSTSLETEYDYFPSAITYPTWRQVFVLLCGAHCNLEPGQSVTLLVGSTLEYQFMPEYTWVQESYQTSYSVPYTYTVSGVYELWSTATASLPYTYYESQPYTYSYTTYNTYEQAYSYTYYNNVPSSTPYSYTVGVPQTYTYKTPQTQPTQVAGTAYLNQTTIINGEYQPNYTNTTYTYYETTGWDQNTGTYYPTTEQETGYAPTTTSQPQTVNNPYLYSTPQTNSAQAYQTQATTRYYTVWSPYISSTQFYSYQNTGFVTDTATVYYAYETVSYTSVPIYAPQYKTYTCPSYFVLFGLMCAWGILGTVYLSSTTYTPIPVPTLQTSWASHTYTRYWGTPNTHTYFVYGTVYHRYPYEYYSTSFQPETGYRGEHYANLNSETTYNTVYQPETGYYWASTPQTNTAPYYAKGPPVSVGYTYTNATLTLTNGETYIVGIIYANPNPALGVYYVPLSNPETGDTAAQWLLQQGWQPMSPQQWANWQSWSTPPSQGQCAAANGCGWTSSGLPFTTNGEYVPGSGVLLEAGQWITAPYAPRYAVGFLSSSGLVFWVA